MTHVSKNTWKVYGPDNMKYMGQIVLGFIELYQTNDTMSLQQLYLTSDTMHYLAETERMTGLREKGGFPIIKGLVSSQTNKTQIPTCWLQCLL